MEGASHWRSKTRFAPQPIQSSIRSIPISSKQFKRTMKNKVQRRLNKPRRTVSIIGTGSYLPERILTNHDLEKIVETNDEWIRTRTGIAERRIAAKEESTSDMATHAARAAMEQAQVTAEEIDLIIVATVTPDMAFPATA